MKTSSPLMRELIHPLWLRLCHWTNALAIVVMLMSGWRIYDASPLFSFSFPKSITLGGWLGGALQWHFAAMWVFALNGILYLLINLCSGRFKVRFLPLGVGDLIRDLKAALHGRLTHTDARHYNMVQKFAYVSMVLAAGGLIISGLVLWKSVQFPFLRSLLGGYDSARFIHFYLMAFIAAFIVVHLVMVMLVPKTFLTIVRGR
ncbi:cytochrome b/b6 domain-containing protein [Pseudomonas sp. RC10]|uniref:cytochrome b/b6 domain-containing protein n=1 Tax=Pseudomonas bambusae TaxID=3139142 RepID=UPI0031393475